MASEPVPHRRLWAVFGGAVVVSGVLLVDLCDLIFNCGCAPLWAGAASACNVHDPAPPHCPWCAHPVWGGAVAFFAVMATQAAVVFGPSGLGLAPRIGLVLVVPPLVAVGLGIVQGLLFGYWS